MQGGEKELAYLVMKNRTDQLEGLVGVAQSVTMCQVENLIENLQGGWLTVNDDTTLFLQIAESPDIVITGKEMHLHTHVCQFGELA